MVKPIDHDGLSAASTGISGAAKGTVGGFLGGSVVGGLAALLAPIAVGAGIGALVLGGPLLVGGLLIALTPFAEVGAALGVAAAGAGIGGFIGAVAGAIPGVIATPAGVATGATIGTVGGGLFGLMKGGQKAIDEKAAFQRRVDRRSGVEESKLQQAQMAGMQEGYQMGAMEAKQAIMAQLQQAHAQMLMANNGLSQEPGAQAAKVDASRAAGLGSPAIA